MDGILIKPGTRIERSGGNEGVVDGGSRREGVVVERGGAKRGEKKVEDVRAHTKPVLKSNEFNFPETEGTFVSFVAFEIF